MDTAITVHKTSYYIINGITTYRLAAAPFLLVLLIQGNLELFKWLLGISFFTDAIDGFLARKFKVTSVFGARLDSIGDDLTVLMGIVGLVMYKMDFLKEHLGMIFLLLGLLAVQVALALYRYRKMTSFHTILAKIAAVAQGMFLILAFFTETPNVALFYTAAIITAVELIEETIMVLVLKKWTPDVLGLYWALKKSKSAF